MASIAEIKNWYDKKYAVRGKEAWRPKEAYKNFLRGIPPGQGKKLLDVGCGSGYLLSAALARGFDAYGIDLSEAGVAIAKQEAPQATVVAGQLETLPYPDRTFDCVACLGVLEHAVDMRAGILEMARVAKHDAQLVIMVPNRNFLYWRLHGIPGTDQSAISENPLSKTEWLKLFKSAGLVPVSVSQDKWPMTRIHPFSERNSLRMLKAAVNKLIWTFLPLALCYQFIFTLQKERSG